MPLPQALVYVSGPWWKACFPVEPVLIIDTVTKGIYIGPGIVAQVISADLEG